MTGNALELKSVETYYGKVRALKDVSFSVPAGSVVALLGANGAGKTTTLRTISGLERASTGTISMLGEDISKEAAHRIVSRGLIHVPEGRRIFKDLTVRENLELGSFTLRGETSRKSRLEEVFSLFPVLRDRHKQLGGTLSGGEQQMLAIGRAMMVKPKVLLLDEPSMGLAPLIVVEIMKIIAKLHDEGITILLVEQNAKAALKIADFGYVLETGEIVMQGTAETLRCDDRIIKAYLGS